MTPDTLTSLRSYETQRLADVLMRILFTIVASGTVILLIGIFAFLLKSGGGMFAEVGPVEFLFGTKWNPNSIVEAAWGVLPLAVSTVMVAFGALLFAVPFDLALAIYLSFLASKR